MTEQFKMNEITYALAMTNKDSEEILFAARSSGLFTSTDGGETWIDAYTSLAPPEALSTQAVALSPNFNSEPTVFAGVAGGVVRSRDGGNTWYISSLPEPPPVVSCLAVSPNFLVDGVVLTGTMQDGVYRSADRGSHFVSWNFGLLDLAVLCMSMSPDYATDETIYVGTESGIFNSRNGGRAWREVEMPCSFDPVLSLALVKNFAEKGILLAGTETQGLYRSDDRGKSWSRLNDPTQDGVVLNEPVNEIILSPAYPETPHILINLSGAMFVTKDDGKTWEQILTELTDEDPVNTLLAPQGFAPGNTCYINLTSGKIIKHTFA